MAEDKNSVFGVRLKETLKASGVTQNELAKKVGITEATISRYVNGNRIAKGAIVRKIADELGVTSDYLLGVEENSEVADYKKLKRLLKKSSENLTSDQKLEIINIIAGGVKNA